MKKIEIFCDDCKAKIEKAKQYDYDGHDICPKCIQIRIQQSFDDYPIGKLTCPKCNNTGKVRVRVGVNDNYEMRPEYENQECQICKYGLKLRVNTK